MKLTEKDKELARRIERGIKKYLKDGKKLVGCVWGAGPQGPACALGACMIAEDGHARELGTARAQSTFGVTEDWVNGFVRAFDGVEGPTSTTASLLGSAMRKKYIDGDETVVIPGTEPKPKKAKTKPEFQVADPERTGRILEDAIRRGSYVKDIKEQRGLVLGKK